MKVLISSIMLALAMIYSDLASAQTTQNVKKTLKTNSTKTKSIAAKKTGSQKKSAPRLKTRRSSKTTQLNKSTTQSMSPASAANKPTTITPRQQSQLRTRKPRVHSSLVRISPVIAASNTSIDGSGVRSGLTDGYTTTNDQTTITSINKTDISSQTRMSGGVNVEFGRRNFVFETGLHYRPMAFMVNSTANATHTNESDVATEGSVRYSTLVNMDYLSIPVLAKFYISNPNQTSAYVRAGVLLSALANNGFTYDNSTKTVEGVLLNPAFSEKTLSMNSTMAEALIGIGTNISLSNNLDLILDATYTRGITSPFSNISDAYFTNSGISAGLRIEI